MLVLDSKILWLPSARLVYHKCSRFHAPTLEQGIMNSIHKLFSKAFHYKCRPPFKSWCLHCLKITGYTGVVYCLDSSPDALRIQLKSHLGELTDSELQNVVLEHLSQLMTGSVSEELTQNLEQINEWKGKVDACLYTMRKLENYSKQYKRSILESAYRRILLARNYEPDFKLNSELVLIKGLPHPMADSLPEDYNLSKYTNKPVKVFNIESDHASAPYDCKVSNIVNKMLDPTLLEEFKTKNLCETYFIRSTK